MKNNYREILKTLINFGISNTEELPIDERRKRVKEFRDNLSYEKYSDLFTNLEAYILNNDINLIEKEEVISLIIELIRAYSKFEDNIELFPNTIKLLFKNYNDFNRLKILFEQVYYSDICMIIDYTNIVYDYLDFLDNSSNELFIQYCYSKILDFNEKLIIYLDKTESTGIKHRDIINNPELENTLKERLNILSNRRK